MAVKAASEKNPKQQKALSGMLTVELIQRPAW